MLLGELFGWLLGELNNLLLLEKRRGSVGWQRQKQQRGRGINIALCTLEGSSVPEQGDECFSAHYQRIQQPTDHKK